MFSAVVNFKFLFVHDLDCQKNINNFTQYLNCKLVVNYSNYSIFIPKRMMLDLWQMYLMSHVAISDLFSIFIL